MMREGKKRGRRWLALLLCMLMILSSNFSFAVAAGAEDTGLCEHHTAHTADCGYAAAVEGQPCQHEHDESCGYAAAVPKPSCDKGCADTDGDGVIDHAADCACNKAAVLETACTHVHDEGCGYVKATAGSPCAYVCEICSAEQGAAEKQENEENTENEDVAPVSEIGKNLDGDYAYISDAYLLPDATTDSEDTVGYTVRVKSKVREDAPYKAYEAGTLRFEFVLPGDSSQVQFETGSMGWLLAKKDVAYTVTEESYDGQTYQVLRGSFLWESNDQSPAIGGSYQELGIVIKVLDNTEQPRFTFWLEGNDVPVPAEGLVTGSDHICSAHQEKEYKTVTEPAVAVTAAQVLSDATEIYVSSTGDDEQNTGTKDSPFATLTKAVEVASDGATIYVMSDLAMNQCARFYDKHLTITSEQGGPFTITRGNVDKQSDNARGWYNPAMIEVQSSSGSSVGLTLSNIVLDDAGKSNGSVFAQAVSGGGGDNTVYVQDAIIASNATVPCTITLGAGAVLRNFGGMSAVRATDQATIVMGSGSVIEDTIITRSKGANGSVGPAGAVWLQGGTLVMQSGSTIRNINGRAVYADGGKVEIGGTISGIAANKNAMWQADNGTAIHLRNSAEGTLTSTALIQEISGGGSMIYCADGGRSFTMNNGSKITSSPNLNGNAIYAQNSTVVIDGEISDVYATGNHILQTAGGTTVTIGENGRILNNRVNYGAIYINGTDEQLNIYGKINGNICTDRGGGVVLSNNGGNHNAVMYPGAEICNNTSEQTGGGVMVSKGTFTMNGGTISNNVSGMDSTKSEADRIGGGVFVRRGGQFIMNDGTIENNATTAFGGGVCFDASDYGNMVPKVELNGGIIANNLMNAAIAGDNTVTVSGGDSNDLAITSKDYGKDDRYLSISDEVTLGNKAVYFQAGAKAVTPADNSLDIKLGNTSAANVATLTNASTAKGWNAPLGTLWVQRDGAATLTVGGLTALDNGLPVYVLALSVGVDGAAAADAEAQAYAAQKASEAGTVSFTLPDISGNGYAIAIVQPTTDYGTLTISGPETIEQNKAGTDYPVTYTVTYAMSTSMKAIVEQSGGKAGYVLEITQDSRLVGNPGSFNGESIEVTYSLPNSEFKAGDFLLASAKLKITVGQHDYIVPSNVTKTQMVEATYSLTTQVNGGHGTISASKTGLAAGSHETIIFAPDTGYEIDAVAVNGVKTEVLSNILEVIMDEDKNVIVTYKEISHTHSYGADWKSDADSHWHECACGDKTDTAAHTFKWVNDKEATATEKGFKHEECTVCGYKKAAVEIPATGSATKPTYQTNKNGYIKTGDNSNLTLWIALLSVSGAAAIGVLIISRKKKSRQ